MKNEKNDALIGKADKMSTQSVILSLSKDLLLQHKYALDIKPKKSTNDYWKWSAASKKFIMFSHKIPAGFPSPANDFVEKTLSLDDLLVEHPNATFFVKVTGDSMKNVGILSGDVLVIDRTKEPINKCIVVAVVNGEMTVKRLIKKSSQIELHAENPNYQPIFFKNEEELVVWGVVVGVVRKVF